MEGGCLPIAPGMVGAVEWVQITTADGHVLDADVADAERPAAAAVLCHPHPQYGGSRFDRVVSAVFDALPAHGVTVLRFDFRRSFGGGVDERLDAIAAVDSLRDRVGNVPMHLVGYSFGAMVTLGTRHEAVASRVMIAPPFPADPALSAAGPHTGPAFVIVPEHDQFCPPDEARPIVDAWPTGKRARFATVDMADHFLAGRTTVVAHLVADWIAGTDRSC